MKRKFLSLLMVATMAAGLLVGCGGSSDQAADTAKDTKTTEAAAEDTEACLLYTSPSPRDRG